MSKKTCQKWPNCECSARADCPHDKVTATHVSIDDLSDLDLLLENNFRINEIKIIQNEVVAEGQPILMLHPKDFEKYKDMFTTKLNG